MSTYTFTITGSFHAEDGQIGAKVADWLAANLGASPEDENVFPVAMEALTDEDEAARTLTQLAWAEVVRLFYRMEIPMGQSTSDALRVSLADFEDEGPGPADPAGGHHHG